MKSIRSTENIVVGDYLAAVDVELLDDNDPMCGWGPYFSANDAMRLDKVRVALREHRIEDASHLARVYRLTPVSAA